MPGASDTALSNFNSLALQLIVLSLAIFILSILRPTLVDDRGFFIGFSVVVIVAAQISAYIYPMPTLAQRVIDYFYYLLAAVAVVLLFSQLGGERDRQRLFNAEAEYDHTKVAYGLACRKHYFDIGRMDNLAEYYLHWNPYYDIGTRNLFVDLEFSDKLCLAAHAETHFLQRGWLEIEDSNKVKSEYVDFCVQDETRTVEPASPSAIGEMLVLNELYQCDVSWSFDVWLDYLDDPKTRTRFSSANNTDAVLLNSQSGIQNFIESALAPPGNNDGYSVLAILRADAIFGGRLPGHNDRDSIPSDLNARFDALANSAAWYLHYLEKTSLLNVRSNSFGLPSRILGMRSFEIVFFWPYLLVCALALRLAKTMSELRRSKR